MNQLFSMPSVVGIILGGIVGMILQWVAIWISRWWASKNSVLNGVWYEALSPFQGLPQRWDKIHLRQVGGVFCGKAHRISHKSERKRKWTIVGYNHGNRLIALYYIKSQRNDPASYGTIVLVRDASLRNEVLWRGHYDRPEFTDPREIISGEIPRGTMWWQRSHPQETCHDSPEALPGAEKVALT